MLAALIAIAAGASAQTNTGEIGGVVVDSNGGVLPGTAVVATHSATGFIVERVTDAEGRFLSAGAAHRRVGGGRRAARFPAHHPDRDRPRDRTDAPAPVHAVARRDQRRGDGRVPCTAPAGDHGRDQRCHRNPRDRADSAQRSAVPPARAAERRGGDPAGWHSGRGPATSRAVTQRRRSTRRAQHLHARRVQGHRRAVQQPCDQPVGRLDPGVQDSEVDVSSRVRWQGVGADQRGDQVGRQPRPRQSVRVRPR